MISMSSVKKGEMKNQTKKKTLKKDHINVAQGYGWQMVCHMFSYACVHAFCSVE